MNRTAVSRTEKSCGGEVGQAAVFGVLILLMFSAYGIMSVMDVAKESASVVYGLRSQEALYAAEAGLEYAIEEIKAGKPDAGNISNLRIGNMTVTVQNQNNRTLTSTASAGDLALSRSITLRIQVSRLPGAFEYALYVDHARNENFNGRGTIEGNILFDGDRIKFGKRMNLRDTIVYVPRSAVIQDKSGSPFVRHDYMYRDEPPDDFPHLATGYYRSYVDNDGGYQSQIPLIFFPVDLKNYEDRVFYCDWTLIILSTVRGPGVICSRDNIILMGNARLGPGVTVIAGKDLTVWNSTVESGRDIDSILFSFDRTWILDGSDITASVVSAGDLITGGSASVTGPCLVRGTLFLNGDFSNEGSLVTRRLGRFSGNGTIRYSDEAADVPGIPGLTGRSNVDRLSWKEI